jgi:hypothetical protein
MKTGLSAISAAIALALTLPVQAANYSYHGELMDGDVPADGAYDLRVRSFADRGADKAHAFTTELPAVAVVDGRFSVELDLPEDADGTNWVEVAVRKSGSNDAYETLGNPVAVAKGSATCPGAWALDGNSALPAGSFLGAVDANAPLELRANGRTVARFDSTFVPGFIESPKVTFGASSNAAIGLGSTVSGGGTTHDGDTSNPDLYPFNWNSAFGDYGTVAGGLGNRAPGAGAVVGGGLQNCAGGSNSWAGGSGAKVRGRSGIDFRYGCSDISGDANGDEGTFVWNSDPNGSFVSSGPRQFLLSAPGGVGINTATKPNGTSPIDSELTITSNTARADTNVDIAMYPRNGTHGYLVGVQGTTQANTEYFLTQTDGLSFFPRFAITGAGTTLVVGGAVGTLSDARLKKNVGEIDSPLATLLSLHGQTFEYIDPAASMNHPGARMGFIAQEVQQVLPSWVAPAKDGYLGVSTIGFEALAVEAIRDLKAEGDVRLEQLEAEHRAHVARLDAENAELRTALKSLAARLARVEASTRDQK